EEGISPFEELFLYACPKFISANPPPYEDPELLAAYVEDPPVEPALFLSEKLANFLDADEEEMVQQMMVMNQASRSISRLENDKGLLDGLGFRDRRESTVGRRFAGCPLPVPPKPVAQKPAANGTMTSADAILHHHVSASIHLPATYVHNELEHLLLKQSMPTPDCGEPARPNRGEDDWAEAGAGTTDAGSGARLASGGCHLTALVCRSPRVSPCTKHMAAAGATAENEVAGTFQAVLTRESARRGRSSNAPVASRLIRCATVNAERSGCVHVRGRG
ncbi:uncharacterized protein LAESUDRAFT_765369, partial [Laetiporus sulphureus 93-53]